MKQSKWNTYVSYGIHRYQVRKTATGWRQRTLQTNDQTGQNPESWTVVGPEARIDDGIGEACYAAARGGYVKWIP